MNEKFNQNILKQYETFLSNELNYYLYDFGIYHTQVKTNKDIFVIHILGNTTTDNKIISDFDIHIFL